MSQKHSFFSFSAHKIDTKRSLREYTPDPKIAFVDDEFILEVPFAYSKVR